MYITYNKHKKKIIKIYTNVIVCAGNSENAPLP